MKAEEIREALKAEPKLLELAEILRARFDAKLVWLKTPQLELGRRIEGAIVVIL